MTRLLNTAKSRLQLRHLFISDAGDQNLRRADGLARMRRLR